RVAIVQDNLLSDLEIEIAAKKQIKGNIYLGKVSRVEQSLQAAFIDFGHGRQGFLPLNDIHVKYFTDDEPEEEPKETPRKKGRGRGKKTPKAQALPKAADPQLTKNVDELDADTSQEKTQEITPDINLGDAQAIENAPASNKSETVVSTHKQTYGEIVAPKERAAIAPARDQAFFQPVADTLNEDIVKAKEQADDQTIASSVSDLTNTVTDTVLDQTTVTSSSDSTSVPTEQATNEITPSSENNPTTSDADQSNQQQSETSSDDATISTTDQNIQQNSEISSGGATTKQTKPETTQKPLAELTTDNTQAVEPQEEQKAETNKPTASEKKPAPKKRAKKTEKKPPAERTRRPARRRPPPIQQILTRGQTVLVQVVKEARGNKGASLTTNISLAGRYSVLLPENSGGGGISRKINNGEARKNLKEILSSLDIPEHVSLIIRTAGLNRTKREILRDMNYMLRVWKKIQEKMEKAEAPCLIHEEGDLITRTIRDLYTNDMEEILIEGHECYRRGKDFMRLLMPSYVKVVQPYKDSIPLFSRYQVENQIETMHNRIAQLKSGGYLVIESTEAMVTIDINSGRSTKEKDIETTAFKTNMLAADEIARQLRLRDLGGLVVIDFIDMDDKKHNIEVEKRVNEAFKHDRARIQIGRISQFGLLELSRQRMKPAFNEATLQECPRCKGLGSIRAIESSAVYLFRCIEEEISKGETDRLVYYAPQDVVNYIFNHKRRQLLNLEDGNNVNIIINSDPELQTPEFRREKTEKNNNHDKGGNKEKNDKQEQDKNREAASKTEESTPKQTQQKVQPQTKPEQSNGEPVLEQNTATSTTPKAATDTPETEETPPPKKRRRRRRRRRRSSNTPQGENTQTQANTETQQGSPTAEQTTGQPVTQTSEQPFGQVAGQPSKQPESQTAKQTSGQSASQTNGQPTSQTNRQPSGQSASLSPKLSSGQSVSQSLKQSSGQSASHTTNQPSGQSTSQSQNHPSGQNPSQTTGQPVKQTSGQSASQTHGKPASQTHGKPASQTAKQISEQPTNPQTKQSSGQTTTQTASETSGQDVSQTSEQTNKKPSRQTNRKPSRQNNRRAAKQPECQITAQSSKNSSEQKPSSPTPANVEAKEAIPTTVPGLYVLPEAQPATKTTQSDSAEKVKAEGGEQTATQAEQTIDPSSTEKRPRRRRRRRRPAANKPPVIADGNSSPSSEGNSSGSEANSSGSNNNTKPSSPSAVSNAKQSGLASKSGDEKPSGPSTNAGSDTKH
ncbi:MAG: Rne/Rng family ribonuclease, partial [Magnetococcales bacterium]|nr:Rne/Rng family ribonuclease [Magnetococcales bacterium]